MATHKILVIDDSNVIRNMVRGMLPEGGQFEVLEAKDGVQGLNLIQQEHPNLIMLDFLLPKMSGYEVYQHIQENPSLRTIPLVLMSGRKEEVTEKLPEPFQYFEFVQKPFDQKELMEAIKSAMAKAKKIPAPVGVPAGGGSGGADVQALTQKVAKLEAEVATLKKQLGQILTFIKQKLR